MKTRKPARVGRRSGLRVPNNIRKNDDGTDVYLDYFDTTVEETTFARSELQDTLPSYNIQYTDVSLEPDTSDTNQISQVIAKEDLGKNVKSSQKMIPRRRVGRARKKYSSRKKRSTLAPNSEFEFSCQEKTYVDKSVITSPVSFTRSGLATSRFGLNRSTNRSHNIDSSYTSVPEKVTSLATESVAVSGIGSESMQSSRTPKHSKIPVIEKPVQNLESVKNSNESFLKNSQKKCPEKASSLKLPVKESPMTPAEKVSTHIRPNTLLKNQQSSKIPKPRKTHGPVSAVKNRTPRHGIKRSANKPGEKVTHLTPKNISKSGIDLDTSRTLRSGRIYSPSSKSFTDKTVQQVCNASPQKRVEVQKAVSASKSINPDSKKLRMPSNQEKGPDDSAVPLTNSEITFTIEVRKDNDSSVTKYREMNEQNCDGMSEVQNVKAKETRNFPVNSRFLNVISPHERETMIDSRMSESETKRVNTRSSSQSGIEHKTFMAPSPRNHQSTSQNTNSKDLTKGVTDSCGLDSQTMKKSLCTSSAKRKLDFSPTSKNHGDEDKNKDCEVSDVFFNKRQHISSSQNIGDEHLDIRSEITEQNASNLLPTSETKKHAPKRNGKKKTMQSTKLYNKGIKLSKSGASLSASQRNTSVADRFKDNREIHYENSEASPVASLRKKSEPIPSDMLPVHNNGPNVTFKLNSSKSVRGTSSNVKERVNVEPQTRRADTHLDLDGSQSRIESVNTLKLHSSKNVQHTSLNSSSKNLPIGEDDRNLEESLSQVLGSGKSENNASRKIGKCIDQEIGKDNDGNNIQLRHNDTLSQRKNSKHSVAHIASSEPNTSNHPTDKPLLKPKKRGTKKLKKNWNKTPSPTPYLLKRPKRNRIRPLAYWKGEHRTYCYTKDMDIVLVASNLVKDDSTTTDSGKRKQKSQKKQKTKEDIPDTQKQLLYFDEVEEEEKELVTIFNELEWKTEDSSGTNTSYRVARSNWKNTTGYLELDVKGCKEKQYSPFNDIQFVVLEGTVQFQVAGNIVNLGKKDGIIVPCRIAYSIKNCCKRKSVLLFTSVVNN